MTVDKLLERIANGRTDLIWDLVAHRHPGSSGADESGRLLQWSAYYGDVSAVRFLLAQGGSLKALGDDLGLRGAAFHGHWQLCEFLIEAGADVNGAAPNTGETPLHSALCTVEQSAYDIVVKVLLAHGADPNRPTKPSVETGCFMRDCRTKGETALHRAAAFGSEVTIDLLIGAGATLDAKDMNGDTPLSWASWYCRPDAILRRLCYGQFTIRPDRKPMHISLLGQPHGQE
jgi:ankyrin repeat protein